MFPTPAKFCSFPYFGQILGGENPRMPKIYAEHKSVPCGLFITAEEPAGGGRGWVPQQTAPPHFQAERRGFCPRRLSFGTAPTPLSSQRTPAGPPWMVGCSEAPSCLLSSLELGMCDSGGVALGCGHRGLPRRLPPTPEGPRSPGTAQ